LRLEEIHLTDANYFVAMEYHAFILNRTFLILIAEGRMIGIVVSGVIAANDRGDHLTRLVSDKLSPDGDLTNPLTYINERYRKKYKDIDLVSGDLSTINKANFQIALSEITDVTYDPSKKWGVGPYPHDGKIYVTANGSRREFIILGSQSGEKIAKVIQDSLPSVLA